MTQGVRLRFGKQKVDPLTVGPHAARVLMTRFSEIANNGGAGFSRDDVVNAAANIILNALRQEYPKHKDADEALSRVLDKCRGALANHYDPVTKRRRSVFPFDQIVIIPGVLDFRPKR